MGSSNATSNALLVEEENDLSWYLPLFKAVIQGDWDATKNFLGADPNAVTAKITKHEETTLHIAVGFVKTTQFLENLLKLITDPELLETLVDWEGRTVLHTAAQYGNIEAARILVALNPRLPNTSRMYGSLPETPLLEAARFGHRELILYLYSVTKEDVLYFQKIKQDVHPNPLAGEPGLWLLANLIFSEIYDVALALVQRYPELGTLQVDKGYFPLDAIAGNPSAFPSGTRYKSWQWLIYSCVPVKSENISNVYDSENPCECNLLCTETGTWARFLSRDHFIHVCQKFHRIIWSIMERLAPPIKNIRETKYTHSQTLELVKCLCMGIASLDHETATTRFTYPIHCATKEGIHEVVEEILEIFPACWGVAKDGSTIFHQTVLNRREKVFNLLCQSGEYIRLGTNGLDDNGNSILHLAAKLAPSHRINLVSGAALQMQRELQWYKEVTKWVTPFIRERTNGKGETAAKLFREEHKGLVKEGERWMKDTANSCSLAAALIATIAFAAAITVPGGTNGDSGFPVFSKEATFIVFTISNAISLFSSTAALLMFLSILTARYAEDDFLFSLPSRLIIGLITLFLSITSMMITFSATLYLVVGNKKAWALIAVAVPACLPVTLFVTLQFPLLLDMIRSTYGPGMFGRNKGVTGYRR